MSFLSNFEPYSFKNYGLVRLPTISISIDQKKAVGLPKTASNLEYLTALARIGFTEHNFAKDKYAEYATRIKYELGIFEELGFTDYVLLVWQVINKAREMDVFIDYGRGSCAGSMIFYLLKITGVNPIEKGLFFERFVSRVRSKKQIIDGNVYLQGDLIADADLNLGDGREAIVEWLKTIYPNRISKIMNLSTFTGKILVKDIYKVYAEATEEEANHLSGLIEKHFGIVEEISDVYKENEEFKEWADKNPDCYQIACKLNGLIRQSSVHASGYLISFNELSESIPLECDKEGNLMSGFDMREVSNFAVKLDLLSLTTNKVIKQILDNIDEDVTKINLDDDPLIYDQFQTGQLLPYALYQISGNTGYKVTNEIKPKNILELSDVSAIARPGALAYMKPYIANNHELAHPLFAKALKPTRNLCLYQEQMMKLLECVGFSLDEAEQCRKIVGKKLVEKVKEWKDKIYERVKQNNLPENLGNILWKILDDSAKYSFNLSHSLATSYLSALTVYLKYKYPLEFYCACLNNARDLAKPGETPQDQIAMIRKELEYFKIELLPPDLIKSKMDFTPEGRNIRFGLKLLKGVSEKSIEKLESFKTTERPDKFSLFQSFKNCGINIGMASALIQSGCLSNFGDRTRIVLEAQTWNLLTDKEKKLCLDIGSKPEINFDVFKAILHLKDNKNDNGKLYISESRFETIKKRKEKFQEIYNLNSRHSALASYYYERTILGYSYSQDITDIYEEKIDDLISIREVIDSPAESNVKFIGFAKDCYKSKTKAGNNCYTFDIVDDSGSIKVKIFNQKISACEEINGMLPDDESLCVIEGKKMDNGLIFGSRIGIQSRLIFTKLSELKDAKT